MLKKFSVTSIIRMVLLLMIIVLYYTRNLMNAKMTLTIMSVMMTIMFITGVIDLIRWLIKSNKKRKNRQLKSEVFFENLDSDDDYL